MNWNGIIIAKNEPGPNVLPATSYRGIGYSTPWPLEVCNNLTGDDLAIIQEVNEALPDFMFDDGGFPPPVLTDMDLVYRYVARCRDRKLKIRVLLCGSPRSLPTLEEEKVGRVFDNSQFLGYDYGFSSCDFSSVYSDLNPPPPQLEHFVAMLNEFEIFSELENLNAFVSARWKLLSSSENAIEVNSGETRVSELEDSGDFLPFEVREIAEDFF